VGKSKPLGRVGNKRLIIDFLGRIRFGRPPYTARLVAVCGLLVAVYGSFSCIGIYIRGRGGAPYRVVL
jgi:hypothetical protein